MNRSRSRRALLAFGIVAAFTVGLVPIASDAQSAPQQLPANPQPNRALPDRGSPRDFDRRADRFQDRLERRLDFLHSELRINQTQEQLWAAFADSVRREAELGRNQLLDRRDALRGPDGRFEPPGIVERMERRQQALAERSDRVDRLLSALRPLYAALNNDQRRAADEHLFRPGREGIGRRRFGMNGAFYGPLDRSFGPLERPFGPLDQPPDRFNRYYR